MTTAYDKTYPNPSDPPRNDVQTMQNNALAIYNIWDKDHYTFDGADPGFHRQMRLPVRNAAGAQTDPQCTIYSASGTASTVSDGRLRNQNGIFPLNCTRAFAVFNGTAASPITPGNSFNVTSITRTATGLYAVVLPAGTVTGTSFCVNVSASSDGSGSVLNANYDITGAGTFTIATYRPTFSLQNANSVSFTVTQA